MKIPVKSILATLLVGVCAFPSFSAGRFDPFDATQFKVELPPTAASGWSCNMDDIDSCWAGCEAEAARYGPSYRLFSASCRINSQMFVACSCVIEIPGPYNPPVYWPGPVFSGVNAFGF